MNEELSRMVAAIFSLSLTTLGFSYILRARDWGRVYRDFEEHPARFIPTGLLLFVAGLFIAVIFDDWSSTLPIFITAFGWLMVLEAGLLLLKPSLVGSVMRRFGERQEVYLRLGGLLLFGLGCLLTWEYLLQYAG